MKAKKFLPYARQSINNEDIAQVTQALKSDIITRGPLVKEFENLIAGHCGAKYAVAFNSGTAALDATFFAANTTAYDRVITTPNTFIGTIVGALKSQAIPVFIDIDRNSGNMDIELIDHNINKPSTRGHEIIVPVHFAGIPFDMKRLDSLIKRADTVIIEDAAHALGSFYPSGEPVGSCAWSHMTVFSFHPAKLITTGEGGMVLTNFDELYERLLLYRNNGIVRKPDEWPLWYYEVQNITGNENFTDFQAALGISQFKRLDEFKSHRSKLVEVYRDLLKDQEGIQLFSPKYDQQASYHLFVVQIDFDRFKTDRTEVVKKLLDEEIGSQYHYIPLYRHPYFLKRIADIREYFPEMELYYKRALSLPLHCEMETNDVERVCKTLTKILKKSK
jgi:dTDP-4-amino-4,6-dideoxygalactose transaminase